MIMCVSLSAVKLADKVAVFNDGHMVEYGTHAQLYAKGGLYTEMFDKQAQFIVILQKRLKKQRHKDIRCGSFSTPR